MSEIDEVVGEFLVESYENLDRYDQDLLALERDPSDREILSSVFRTVHTIKGTCGFLGFDRLQQLTHTAENLLGRLRDGELEVDPDIASALLATGDAIRASLEHIEQSGEESADDNDQLVAELARLHRGEAKSDASPAAGPAEAAAASADDAEAVSDDGEDEDDNDKEEANDSRLGSLLVKQGAASEEDVNFAAHEQDFGDQRPLGEILVEQGKAKEDDVEAALGQQASLRGSVADANIRVDVGLLDSLMNLVGELVLVRNQIVQLASVDDTTDSAVNSAAQRLNLVTTELQEGVMKTRMQPIGSVWSRFPRVVRDLAIDCGKQVRVEMEGQDTELDKSIIEAIKDPLTHLVRNAVDHGVEAPERRREAGKREEAVLKLRAYHEGGQVNIEISDDGGGVNGDKVKQKALSRGLLTAEQAAAMTDREAASLIFLPGFSTAETVTNVSGRGVGMDVVKTNIERIGGSVDVATEYGRGTTIKVKIPLTLAIIPALIVTTGEQRFAIPQVNVIELLRLGGDQRGIEMVNGAPVYRLRGKLLPLVHLGTELELTDADAEEGLNVVVLQADDQTFGLIVNEVRDTEEIVVKPLGRHLKNITTIAGATIMGDGRVALILDVFGLAQRAHVVTENGASAADTGAAASAGAGERQRLLIVASGEQQRLAVSLESITRLEELASDEIEWSGGQPVVHYRGRILPLFGLTDVLSGAGTNWYGDSLQVLVTHLDGGTIGVVVDKVLDIVEDLVTVESHTSRAGVLGSAVIQGRVTDVIELDGVVAGSHVQLMTEVSA